MMKVSEGGEGNCRISRPQFKSKERIVDINVSGKDYLDSLYEVAKFEIIYNHISFLKHDFTPKFSKFCFQFYGAT